MAPRESLIRWPDRGLPVKRNGNHAAAVQSAVESVKAASIPTIVYSPWQFWDSTGAWLGAGADADATVGLSGAYKATALAFMCMHYRATKLVEAPLWLSREGPDGDEWLSAREVRESPLWRLLDQPNPDMEFADLMEHTSLLLDQRGLALWHKVRDRSGAVAALYPYSADEFSVEPANGRLYGRFTINHAQGSRVYGPDDVIFFRWADPGNLTGGTGPLEVALAHLNLSQELRRAITSILARAIRPGSITISETNLMPETVARLQEQLNALHGGASKWGKNLLIDGAGKSGSFQQLSASLKDIDFGPVAPAVEATVCGIFDVHPALLGVQIAMENSSGLSDSIRPAQDLFYDRFAIPAWGRIARTLTRSLLREVEEDPAVTLRFDLTKVRALAADMTKRTAEATAAAGYWTRNEQRAHTGQKPLPGPEGEEIPGRVVATAPAEDEGDGEDDTPSAGEKSGTPRLETKVAPSRVIRGREAAAALDSKALDAMWAAFDTKARAGERDYYRAARRLLAADGDAVVAALGGEGKADGDPPVDDRFVRAALEKIEAALGEDGARHQAWLDAYLALIGKTVEVGARDIAAATGLSFTAENIRAQLVIQNRAAALVKNVTETTRQAIREAILVGRAEGEGVRKIASRIRTATGGEIGKRRATVIARTETVGALNAGEHAAAEEAADAGILLSRAWVTQRDGRVRASHRKLDGERVPMGMPYSNGLMAPHAPGAPAREVVQCRCAQLFFDEAAP